uniref:Uncharacterized protein n=1 Tax=Amphora coffeiformis TaxID=265554 RepID=A0A7S3P496_9STRA|eukprot:scaffold34638_cov161-Amphora_coffeaeformis.AAC.10
MAQDPKEEDQAELGMAEITDDSKGGDTDGQEEGVYYVETIGQVWTSKFVLGQLLFNVLASFVGPLGTFYLLFGHLSQGPYEWYSGPLLGVVAGSLAGSPLLIFALMPVGLPEAVEYGWFPRITEKSLQLEAEKQSSWWLLWWLSGGSSPSMMLSILKWKWSTQRNVAMGLVVGIFLVPLALLIARFAFGPTLSMWSLIWFNVVYEVVLCVPVLLLGLLGYALEANLDATLDRMEDQHHPNSVVRLLRRTCASLRMTFSPYY